MNLLSVHKFCLHNNCSCHFDANELKIQDILMGRLFYRGLSKNEVYPIYSRNFLKPTAFPSTSVSPSPQFTQSSCFPTGLHVNKFNNWLLWHHRLGHLSNKVLTNALSSVDASCILPITDSNTHCKHCLNGKMHQLPFDKSDFKASKPLELIHSDVWGPAPTTSINDLKYYVLFVDDYSKFTWLFLLKFKFDVFEVFKYFKATVENQLDSKIKILRTDRGGEFTSNVFKRFCSSNGIIQHLTCPHPPQQNGVAERKHRHLVECALTMLSHSQLPPSYWSYAISTAVHIINRLPTPNLDNLTP